MKKIISVFEDEKSPDMETVSVYDDIAPPESGPVFWPEEISPWRDEGVSDPVEAPLGIMREQLIDPSEAAKRARDISDMAAELKLPIHLSEMYYNLLNDPPKARDPKVQGLISADPMPELQSTWGKFKDFFRGGDITDLPPNPTREERLWKFFDIALTKPMRLVLKAGEGLTLNMPEMARIAMKRNTPKEHWTELDHMTMDEAYDWMAGYNPSGFEKMIGEIAEFIGRIKSVSYLAGKLGLIGNTPADINALDKAAETAKLFALVSGEEEISKFGMMALDPTETEYGYEGPKAVLRDMALGAVFSFIHSGTAGLWKHLTPTEEARALKLLGLKKGATDQQIVQAARDLARNYHPDKIKGYEAEFKKVINARNLLRRGEAKDIVFRGAPVKVQAKLLTTEVQAKATEEAARNRLRAAADILLRHGTKSDPMSTKWELPAVRSLADLMYQPVPNTQEGINALVASVWETVMKEAQKPTGEIKSKEVQPPAAEGKVEMNVTETPEGYFIEDIQGVGGADAIRKLQAEGKPIEAVIAKGGKNTEAARLRGAKALGFKEVGTTEQGAIKVRWEPEKVAPSAPEISITSPSRKGLANVEVAAKVAKYTIGLIEPTKVVTLKHGKETTATVMRGLFGKAERAKVEFDNTTLENSDKTFRQLELEFDKYPQSVLHDLMATRGHGLEDKARAIQKKAFRNLPDELRKSEVRRMIDDIADLNYDYLTKVTGEHIDTLWGEDIINKPNYIRDYFYGIYKDPAKVNQFLNFWRTTDRFLKHKVFPTYADARAYGLELRNPNPIANLRAEHVAIARLESMQWLREELLKHGKGTLVDEIENAPMEWKVIGDPLRPEPTFSDLRVEPDLADLMNNLLARNKITGNPTLNAIRQANNIIRTVKFIGSGFHLIQVAKQSVADAGGYFGFLLPQRWIRYEQGKFKKGPAALGLTTGFRKDDPFFQTELYLDYIENGGSQLGTLESEMKKAWKDAILQLNKGEQTVIKVATAPVKIPLAFVDWMFDSYIPKVKATKYAYEVAKQEKRLGRFLTPAEKQEIIKEQQNFYGEVNEKLYGRSGTKTTAMRFYFTAPGYATGNYRTMAKAALQWGVGEQPTARRSRYNIINSLALTTGIATIGTLLFTGKLPKKPETMEEMRDLLRIDTGQKDEDGRRIMIDLASYEKDYWEVYFNTLTGHPGRAVEMAIKRIGGMRAPFAEFMTDMLQIAGGRQLYDWKNDEVYHITDPFLLKVNKLVLNEIERLIPISASVFKREKERDVDTTIAAMEMLLGLRPAKDEATNRRFEVLKDLWSMRDQRDKQFYFLLTDPTPYESVEFYNQTLDTILNSKFLPAEDKAKWSEELKIDLSAYLKGKEETYRSPANTLEETQQAKKYLTKFEIEPKGIWEGPKSLVDKLSKFNEKRRDLIRKEEKGTLTESQKAKLKLYRSALSNLQNPAKLLLTKQNESQKQNTYRIIEGIIDAPEVFEEIEP